MFKYRIIKYENDPNFHVQFDVANGIDWRDLHRKFESYQDAVEEVERNIKIDNEKNKPVTVIRVFECPV